MLKIKNENLKVVILAAGFGMRLKNNKPKALVDLLPGKTILDYQIEKLTKYIPIDNIIVVVGYKKELVMEHQPGLTFVYNEAYNRTNTAKSLLRAFKKIDCGNVLWVNGDVVFDEEIIPKIINKSSINSTSCVLVDRKKCGQEEVKYSLDKKGYLKQIAKEVVNPEGEALGINFLLHKDLSPLKKHLSLVDDADYFEKALENMISGGVTFTPVYTDGLFCSEIDFPEDLKEVQFYLQSLKSEPALIK